MSPRIRPLARGGGGGSQRARSKNGRQNDDEEANKALPHPTTIPLFGRCGEGRQPLVHMRRALASRDTHGRDPLCAERRRKKDTTVTATDRKTWKTYIYDRRRHALTSRESRRCAASPHAFRKLRAASVLSCTRIFG